MKPVTNEKIYLTLADMKGDIGELKATSVATLEQTKKTNGRVGVLEDWKEKTEETFAYQKGYSKGRMTIVTLLGIVLGFLIGSIIIPIVASYIQAGKL